MPYIHPDQRKELYSRVPITTGELNYKITKVVNEFLTKPLTYSQVNDVVGAMECAKLELYRRLAAPHEDQKMAQNGDVYK